MALADYDPPKRKILFPGGEFEVRAISLPDVAIIVGAHRFAIDQIVGRLRERGGVDLDDHEALAAMLMEAIQESPILAANIISICADEPDEMARAMRLAVPLVFDTLVAIGELTFTDLASVKKFGANVMRLIRGVLPPQTETLAA